MLRNRLLAAAGAACAAALAAPAEAAAPPTVQLLCRGTRMIVDGDGAAAYSWVERVFQVDFAEGEVRDGEGRPLEAEITPGELAIEIEPEGGWPPGRTRIARIVRSDGSWSERPVETTARIDRVRGTCLRFGGGEPS